MRAETFTAYVESSIVGYAEENVASGRWPKESALARSKTEFDSLLPQGLNTPNNHLYEIIDDPNGHTVGFIWFAIQESHGTRVAFVCDVVVKKECRRQGHAKRALVALESIASELNLSAIDLHVFAHNSIAQALYAQSGYAATGINMRKPIGAKNA